MTDTDRKALGGTEEGKSERELVTRQNFLEEVSELLKVVMGGRWRL